MSILDQLFEARDEELEYTEEYNKTTKLLDKVTVQLTSFKSAEATRLGRKYLDLKKQIDELNDKFEPLKKEMKEIYADGKRIVNGEEIIYNFFDDSDKLATRVYKTAKSTEGVINIKISKQAVIKAKKTVDSDKLFGMLNDMSDELKLKYADMLKIIDVCTKTAEETTRASTLTVEGVVSSITNFFKKAVAKIKSIISPEWLKSYDDKLSILNNQIQSFKPQETTSESFISSKANSLLEKFMNNDEFASSLNPTFLVSKFYSISSQDPNIKSIENFEFKDKIYNSLDDIINDFSNIKWIEWSNHNDVPLKGLPNEYLISDDIADYETNQSTIYKLYIKKSNNENLSYDDISTLSDAFDIKIPFYYAK